LRRANKSSYNRCQSKYAAGSAGHLSGIAVTAVIIIVLAALSFFGKKSWRAGAAMAVSMGLIRTLGLANLSRPWDNSGKLVSITRNRKGGILAPES
jgi:hypothetical protein